MTESNLEVVNFDLVKEKYIRNLELSYVPKSNDALFLKNNNFYVFIEFKNGYIDTQKQFAIRKKIYDSVLIFSDVANINISKLRKTMEYVLVYNEETNKEHPEVKKNATVKSSNSLNTFSKTLRNCAGEEYVMFGVNIFKGYCFKEVHTYSVKEFEAYLEKIK